MDEQSTPNIIIIDSNSSFVSIASMALARLSAEVHSAASLEPASNAIRNIKPLILIVDAQELLNHKKLTAELSNSLPLSYLVITGTSSQLEQVKKLQTQFAQVFYRLKPIKAQDLSELVSHIFQLHTCPPDNDVLVISDDSLLKSLLKAVLQKRGSQFLFFSSPEELKSLSPDLIFSSTIYAPTATDQISLGWFDPFRMGKLFLLCDKEPTTIRDSIAAYRLILRPLSHLDLTTILPESREETLETANSSDELSPEQGAILAARISSSVFELLLNQKALRQLNWETTSEEVAKEVRRVCQQFEVFVKAAQKKQQ